MRAAHSTLHSCARALFATLLIIAPVSAVAQEQPTAATSRDDLIAAAREIMKGARFCALITIDEAGLPQARTMDPFPADDNMVVWLATNPKSQKVEQIRADPHVLLYYWDPERMGYVTIAGEARLVDDPEVKARRWKDEWAGFYPDRGHDYLLIEVTPDRLEVLSATRGIEGDPETWAPPSVRFDRQKNHAGPPR